MNRFRIATLVPLALVVATGLAGCETSRKTTTIRCEALDVILQEGQVATIKAATGEATFGSTVCAAVAGMDAANYGSTKSTAITLADGVQYNVSIRQAR